MNFIENETPTKLRGGYYTDPEIASFLTRWVLESQPSSVLEPSCGDGVFFEAIARSPGRRPRSVLAFEIEPTEAEKARRQARPLREVAVRIQTGDFLEWALANIWDPQGFDGVLGNPPFIRYQYLDDTLQARAQKIFAAFNLPFTKHTNVWVPFVIGSLAHLRPGGRLAMVVPSEILHILHAQSLRTLLSRECSRILIIDPQELWFEKTLQGAVLLLAEKKPDKSSACRGVAIVPVWGRGFVEHSPQHYFEKAEFVNGECMSGKWMRALLGKQERELLEHVAARPGVFRFGEIASVDVGIVTGANKFFLVSDAVVSKYRLKRWAYPMFGRSEHVRGIIYDRKNHTENRRLGLATNFLWFGNRELDGFPSSVRRYLQEGEAAGLHRRYKCRIRSPWYNVPSVSVAPVAMLKRSHEFPRLVLNKAKAFTTDTAYRIYPRRADLPQLVFSFVNSLTALSAELEGRHYGGGVLELVPSEIERLLVPVIAEKRVAIQRLDQLFRRRMPGEQLLALQDKVLLKAIGLVEEERNTLLNAWIRLRSRRQRSRAEQEADSQEISMKYGSAVPLAGA